MVFGSSSVVFGNFRKMLRNLRLAFKTILENLRKSLISGRKFKSRLVILTNTILLLLEERLSLDAVKGFSNVI